MFWTVPLSIIGSFSLYAQHWYVSYRFADDAQSPECQMCMQLHMDKENLKADMMLIGYSFIIWNCISFVSYWHKMMDDKS